nr:PREDICTED: TCR gamma alternate reading frame protein [Lepisosteus oculatus]
MLPASIIAYFSFFLVAEAAVTLQQEKITLTKTDGQIAQIRCRVSGTSFATATIHWYQRQDGEVMKRILYVADKTAQYDNKRDADVFVVGNIPGEHFTERYLAIRSVKSSYSATYYCACWDAHSKLNPIDNLFKKI